MMNPMKEQSHHTNETIFSEHEKVSGISNVVPSIFSH